MGSHSGGAVNYEAPIGTAAGTSFATPALPAGSRTRFAVRAFDPATGIEERNTDAVIEIVTDATGADASAVLPEVAGIEAVVCGMGRVLVQWTYLPVPGIANPDGFHVYMNPDPIDWTLPPVVMVPLGPARQYGTTIASLADGVAYAAGVRTFRGTTGSAGVVAQVVASAVPLGDPLDGSSSMTSIGD